MITYEDVIPSIIENTKMRVFISDGEKKQYCITPAEGYVLHDKAWDSEKRDPVTLEITGTEPGYAEGECSCGYDYDFDKNEREFFAVPKSEEKSL